MYSCLSILEKSHKFSQNHSLFSWVSGGIVLDLGWPIVNSPFWAQCNYIKWLEIRIEMISSEDSVITV